MADRKGIFIGIRARMIILFAVIVVLAWAVIGVYFIRQSKELIFKHTFERIDTIGRTFAFNAEYGLLIRDKKMLERVIEGVMREQDIIFALVFDNEGNLVSERPSEMTEKTFLDIKEVSFRQFEKPSLPIEQNIQDVGSIYVTSYPVSTAKAKTAEGVVFLEEEEEEEEEEIGYTAIVFSPKRIYSEIQQVRSGVGIVICVVAIAVIVFVFLIATFFVRNLNRLLLSIRKIEEGDFSARTFIRWRDELGELSDGFNVMAEKLEKTAVSRDSLIKEVEERKRVENELRASQEQLVQSAKLASLGHLVSDMAHEVNNPLMIISGRAQLALRDGVADKAMEEDFSVITDQCERAKDIIQRLLVFSKPSKGDIKEVDLNEVLEFVVKILEHQYKLKNVKIVKNYGRSLPKVKVDEKQIGEVIMNLLKNSAEAMPNGGTISISTSKKGERILVEVEDTGMGIPKDVMKRVFDPFFTTKEKGTGLGLSVCYGIIKAHGGELQYKSTVGKGTTATIFLPLET